MYQEEVLQEEEKVTKGLTENVVPTDMTLNTSQNLRTRS